MAITVAIMAQGMMGAGVGKRLDENGALEAPWQAEGWLRVDAPVPTQWNLRLVRWTPNGVLVDPVSVGSDGTATFQLDDTATRSTGVAIRASSPSMMIPYALPASTPPIVSVGFVGATGIVGAMMRQVLAERSFPFRSIKFLASERSIGKAIEFLGRTYAVERLHPGHLPQQYRRGMRRAERSRGYLQSLWH